MRIAIGMMRAAPVPWEHRGYVAPPSLCVDDVGCQPPAHSRLVSGHDPFEIEALSDCTASNLADCNGERGKRPVPLKIIRSGETENDIRPGADMRIAMRVVRAPVKVGRRPPRSGCLDRRTRGRARVGSKVNSALLLKEA